MNCHVCRYRCESSYILCDRCVHQAFNVAIEHYETTEIPIMIQKSRPDDTGNYEGDAITFLYESLDKRLDHDTSGGRFVIDEWENIVEICKYDHQLFPQFWDNWIDLYWGSFWEETKKRIGG